MSRNNRKNEQLSKAAKELCKWMSAAEGFEEALDRIILNGGNKSSNDKLFMQAKSLWSQYEPCTKNIYNPRIVNGFRLATPNPAILNGNTFYFSYFEAAYHQCWSSWGYLVALFIDKWHKDGLKMNSFYKSATRNSEPYMDFPFTRKIFEELVDNKCSHAAESIIKKSTNRSNGRIDFPYENKIVNVVKECQRATGEFPAFAQGMAVKIIEENDNNIGKQKSDLTIKVIELYNQGLKRSDIAERLGTTVGNVSQIKYRNKPLINNDV